MGGRLRRTAVMCCFLAATLAGCSSGDEPAASTATLGTAPATTAAADPYAVPPVIDEAYVNRVLAGLDAVKGDVTRDVIRTKTITIDAFDRLRAVYDSNEFLQLTIDGLEADIREGFSSYRPNPGNVTTRVSRLLTTAPNCIFAQVQRDYSTVGIKPSPEVGVQWIGLKPLDRSRDPKGLNQTSWALTYDGVPRDRLPPRNPCAG